LSRHGEAFEGEKEGVMMVDFVERGLIYGVAKMSKADIKSKHKLGKKVYKELTVG
jgi:hypothetical protein